MQVFERVGDADLHFPAVSVRVSVVSAMGVGVSVVSEVSVGAVRWVWELSLIHI